MSNENSEETKGLACVSDDALARIVEVDLENHGELKTYEAKAAFQVLVSRTPGLNS